MVLDDFLILFFILAQPHYGAPWPIWGKLGQSHAALWLVQAGHMTCILASDWLAATLQDSLLTLSS